MNSELSTRNSRSGTLLAIFALSLVVRAAVVVGLFGSLEADPDAYRRLAENVRLRGIYTTTHSPTAFRPPLYPLLLTTTVVGGEVSLAAIAALHVVFGAGTVLLTFLLAKACGLRRGAFLAAGLVAIDPILLNQSALVMTETVATFLAAAGMLTLARAARLPTPFNAGLAGASVGLAALCRPTFLPWLGIAGALLLCRGVLTSPAREPATGTSAKGPKADASGSWSNIQVAAIYFAVAALVIAPWAIRNLVVLGKPKVTTTHGGYTVLLGNNPGFYRYLRDGAGGTTWDASELADRWVRRTSSDSPRDSIWDWSIAPQSVPDRASISRSEFEDDAFAYSLARRYILEEPGMFAYACGVRVGRLWQLCPYPRGDSESTARRTLRVLTGVWYSVLFLLAARGAIGLRRELGRSPLVWGVVLCVTFTAVHAVYWSNMRMRAPLMPMVCLLASLGMVMITERLHRRKL